MQEDFKNQPHSTRANALWNALGCFFYLGCQWLTTIFVVLLSSNYENSGTLAFAMSTGNMFAAIALYKIRTFQVSDIDSVFTPDNYVGFPLITIGISAMGTALFLILGTGLNSFTVVSIIYLLFKADESFNDVFFGIEQKASRMDYIGKSQFLRGIATLTGFVIPLAVFDSLIMAILGMSLLCISITLFHDRKNASLFGFSRPSISLAQSKELARSCFLPTIANLLATSVVSIVRQQYGLLYGEELLGIYASIATPAVLVQAAASYIYSPLIGNLAQTRANHSPETFKRKLSETAIAMLVSIGVLCIALSSVGIWGLPRLFGNDIAGYTWIFPFVLLSTGSVAMLYFVNDMLIVIRKGAVQLVLNAVALGLSIVLFTPLTSTFFMNGVNLSIIAGCMTATILGLFYIRFHG